MSKPVVAVLGITGQQGSAVAHALLADGKYKVRGLTRDVTKKASQDWVAKGVELVQGDSTNRDDMKKFFTGANFAFSLTAFWDPTTRGKEKEIGFMNADVAKECGIEYYVFSSLPNVDKISKGKYNVIHFTDKALIEDYIRKLGLKSSFVLPASYLQNFVSMMRKDTKNDEYVMTLPYPETGYYTTVDIDNIGETVKNILNHQDKFSGMQVPVFKDNAPITEYVKVFTEATGKKCRYQQLPKGSFGHEMQEMCDYWEEYTYFGTDKEYLKNAQEANPHLNGFADFLKSGKIDLTKLKDL